ncbi:MAG: YlbF family regulator [Bacilli bacterium]|nr:YlbF family regulator [Bacilli bacterium]
MEERTIASLFALREAIKADPRVKDLEEKEKKMSLSPEVSSLSKAMNKAEDEYEIALNRFGENGEATKEKLKALHEAKLSLDQHPLVEEYTKAYVCVRDLYLYLDDLLFNDFRHPHACGGHK